MTQPKPLTAKQLDLIQYAFEHVVVPVMTKAHAQEDGRSGAVLDARDFKNHTRIFMRAGTAPEDKFGDYEINAPDKNNALEDWPGIVTSWEVHRGDLSQKPYPGGIRTPHDDRISISGFTWQRDTIGGLYLALLADRMSPEDAYLIAVICGIETPYHELLDKLEKPRGALLR